MTVSYRRETIGSLLSFGFGLAITGMPLWFLLRAAYVAIRGRRLRAILGLIALVVLSSLALAAGWLALESRKMNGPEYYSSTGWPIALDYGLHLGAVILLVATVARGCARAVRRRRPRAATP